MIYTLTLNPAVDYVIHVEKLNIGSILRSTDENVFFGGKGINVSAVLHELEVQSVAMGFLSGFTGKEIENGLTRKGIKNDFVYLEKGFTRINIKIRSREETDINGNGPQIEDKDFAALFKKLENLQDGDMLVLAGSIPGTLPKDTYEKIMASFSDKKINFVVDAAGQLLVNALKYRPFLIKPNTDELSEIFSVRISSVDDAAKYALKLQEKGARNVLVSMGADGAVLLDESGSRHFMPAFKGKVINTVGAGDSMVAGFIAGYEKRHDFEYALKLGTAAGSATAFSEGLGDSATIKSILENILKNK